MGPSIGLLNAKGSNKRNGSNRLARLGPKDRRSRTSAPSITNCGSMICLIVRETAVMSSPLEHGLTLSISYHREGGGSFLAHYQPLSGALASLGRRKPLPGLPALLGAPRSGGAA